MKPTKEIVEEIVNRVSKLKQFEKEYAKKENEHGQENVKNRRDELERLLRFIREE